MEGTRNDTTNMSRVYEARTESSDTKILLTATGGKYLCAFFFFLRVQYFGSEIRFR